MRLSLSALLIAIAFAPFARAADAPAAPYQCRWADSPIKLDGEADEPAWKHAVEIDGFQCAWLTGDARKPRSHTTAKLLWDKEYLYFYAEMEDRDLLSVGKVHQDTLWEGDVFELFFKPADDKPPYYEFEVSPANLTLELYFPSRNSGGWLKYAGTTHIQMQTAVKLRGTLDKHDDVDQGWSVEGRIRWADFPADAGGMPKAGDTWKFDLCRCDYTKGQEKPDLSAVAPLTKPDYHHYEDFAPIRFVGPKVPEQSKVDARPHGLERRVNWTTSHVVGSPDGPLPYTIERVYPKLNVFQPLYILEEPGTNNCLLLQHLGSWAGPSRLLRFANDPNVTTPEKLLDVDGLTYGMTLHPDFVHNGYVYLLSNVPNDAPRKDNRIHRFTIDRNTGRIDPKSELVILQWDSNGHNGGDLAFGPDGMLYHASGDGTTDSDWNFRGQDLTSLNSKMLRLDVDHPDAGRNYSVPKDNPQWPVEGARPEAWAYGFRNPWRITFDRKNGNLWVGQNGQDLWEEVYLVHKGENYGWSVYEGSHPFQIHRKQGPTPITPPIVEHPHSEMRSLTGGVVYYGSKLPDLDGAYVYGDWSTGRIFGVKVDAAGHVTWHHELARTTLQITNFCETGDGDLLVVDDQGNGIYKLIPSPPADPNQHFPTKLSETGLFASTKDDVPEAGLIPYDVNASLWSDGALKERFIAVPGDGQMEVTPNHGWNCPEGTVFVKTFSLEREPGNAASRVRVETRLMTRQVGQWVGYTYAWNDEQTDATLVGAAGQDRDYTVAGEKQTWHYPSRAECMTCHSRAMNFVLGVSTEQLNKEHEYPSGVRDNQLRALEHVGMLKSPLTKAPAELPKLTDYADASADLNLRARSYLHANCAICHVKEGGGNGLMELEFSKPQKEAHLVNAEPQHERFGLPDAKLVAPGHPESSVLLHRVSIRGTGQMPPLATSRVDESAVKMLREWIAGLKAE